MNMNNSNHFFTSDLTLAATLLSCGIALEDIDKSDPHRAIFSFPRTPQIEQKVKEFWERETRIDPLAFNDQVRYLKSIIYQ